MIFKKSPYKTSLKNRGQSPFNYKKGFSIVELAVVTAIIAILSALTYYSYTKIADQNRVTSLKSDLTKASVDLQDFYNTYGKYPDTIDCNTGNNSTNICLQSTSGNTYTYTRSNIGNPAFVLINTNISGQYMITNSSAIESVSIPKNIVASGLVLDLDSAVADSYSGSGSNWADLSGFGNDATLYNSPTYSNGVLSFNGSNQYASTNVSSTLAVTTAFTATSWFRLSSAPVASEIRLMLGTPPTGVYTTQSSWATGWIDASTNTHRYLIGTNGTTGWVSTNDFVYTSAVGTWYESTMTYDGSALRVYFNGTLVKTATVTGSVAQTAARVSIAAYNNSTVPSFTPAAIPVNMLWNRALTDAERLQNFNALRTRYGL